MVKPFGRQVDVAPGVLIVKDFYTHLMTFFKPDFHKQLPIEKNSTIIPNIFILCRCRKTQNEN